MEKCLRLLYGETLYGEEESKRPEVLPLDPITIAGCARVGVIHKRAEALQWNALTTLTGLLVPGSPELEAMTRSPWFAAIKPEVRATVRAKYLGHLQSLREWGIIGRVESEPRFVNGYFCVDKDAKHSRATIASMQKELDLLKKKKRHRAEEPDSTAIAFGGRVRSWQFKYLTLVGCEFYAMVERPWDFHPLMAFLADPMPRLEFAPPLLARYRAMRGMALLTEGLSQLAKLSASNPPRTNQTLIALRECVALYLVTRSECSNQSLGTFLRLGQLEMNEAMGYPEQDFRSIKVKSVVSSETLRVYSGAEWACNLSNPELVTGEAYRNPEQYREDCDADRKRGVRRDIGDGGWTHVGTHAGGLAATELPHRSITEVGQMASNANRPTRTLLEARGRGDGRCKKCARPGHLGRSCPRPDPRYRPENEWWFLKQVLAGNEKVV